MRGPLAPAAALAAVLAIAAAIAPLSLGACSRTPTQQPPLTGSAEVILTPTH